MTINIYQLMTRNALIEKGLPQVTDPEVINGLPITYNIAEMLTEAGALSHTINITYDNVLLPVRLHERGGIFVDYDGKYGAWEDSRGVLYLGVSSES